MVPSETAVFEEIADTRNESPDAVLIIRTALRQADERTRQLCSLIGLENLSYEEVSERLGIPVGSVGPLYIRAKSRLRRLIAVG